MLKYIKKVKAMKNIGENFKFLRQTKQKSVYDIEKEIGISHELQYKWEKGLAEPSIIKCIKLADYYGISLDELVGREI